MNELLLSISMMFTLASPPAQLSTDENRIILLNTLAVAMARNAVVPNDWINTVFGEGMISIQNGAIEARQPNGRIKVVVFKKEPFMEFKLQFLGGRKTGEYQIGDHILTHYEINPLIYRIRQFLFGIRPLIPFAQRVIPTMTVTQPIEVSSTDLIKIKQIFRGDHELLMRDRRSGVHKHGRSMYLDLETPIVVGGETCRILKFKGVFPENKFGLFVKKYPTTRKTIHVEAGEVLYSELRDKAEPFGTMSVEAFETESAFNERQIGYVQIGHGSYSHGRKFIVYGLREPDYRLTHFLGMANRINVINGVGDVLDAETTKTFYLKLGHVVRQLHDDGIAHGMLHAMNVGINTVGNELFPCLRDWETGKRIGGMPTKDQAGWRFVDVENVVADAIDDKNKEAFLKGYFHDMSTEMVKQIHFEMMADTWDIMTKGRNVNLSRNFSMTMRVLEFYSMDNIAGNCARDVDNNLRLTDLMQSFS